MPIKPDFYKEELLLMRENYKKKPLKDIKLKCPKWLDSKDPMYELYAKKSILLQQGEIVYANIVQANNFLFEKKPRYDCPAQIVFSKDPYLVENPKPLSVTARNIFAMKGKDPEKVKKEWRAIAFAVTNEHDRSSFTFPMSVDERSFECNLIPTMIHRDLLPEGRLCASLFPVLTAPGCKQVMILPKKYWTKNFTQAWVEGFV